MKDEIFGVLQRVGRSFMLPVAILPIAGILLGLGASFTNATTIETYGLSAVLGAGTPLHALLSIMASAGSTIFGNLPIIFAVGVAIDPGLVTTLPINLQVDVEGPTRGRTIGDVTRLNDPRKTSRAALDVDVDRFLEEFMSRITSRLRAR